MVPGDPHGAHRSSLADFCLCSPTHLEAGAALSLPPWWGPQCPIWVSLKSYTHKTLVYAAGFQVFIDTCYLHFVPLGSKTSATSLRPAPLANFLIPLLIPVPTFKLSSGFPGRTWELCPGSGSLMQHLYGPHLLPIPWNCAGNRYFIIFIRISWLPAPECS